MSTYRPRAAAFCSFRCVAKRMLLFHLYLDSWTCHHVAGLQQTAEHKASGYELYSLCNSPSLVYLLGWAERWPRGALKVRNGFWVHNVTCCRHCATKTRRPFDMSQLWTVLSCLVTTICVQMLADTHAQHWHAQRETAAHFCQNICGVFNISLYLCVLVSVKQSTCCVK